MDIIEHLLVVFKKQIPTVNLFIFNVNLEEVSSLQTLSLSLSGKRLQ